MLLAGHEHHLMQGITDAPAMNHGDHGTIGHMMTMAVRIKYSPLYDAFLVYEQEKPFASPFIFSQHEYNV